MSSLMKVKRKKWTLARVFKELLIGLAILFFVSIVVNYIRKPDLAFDTLPTIDGKLVDGSSFAIPKNKPIILHFWGSWCPICRTEASNVERVSKKYTVLTIAVNSGDDEAIEAYMKKNKLDFKVLNDREGKWAEKFNVKVFPTTFIYDKERKLQFTEVGYTTTAGLLARMALLE